MVSEACSLPSNLIAQMALIRRFEETVLRLFSEDKLYGTTHTCIGQEAIAVAIGANRDPGDIVFSSHRCHGHFIAYGGPPELLLAEMMGRAAGVCGGRGGSQHLHYGRFFSSGVQGGVVGNAVGAALTEKLARSDNLVVAFLGDGTLGEGLVYESLNFAALRQLPILFVLEDNRYAQSTPVEAAVAGSMPARAAAFGIPADEVDTNDLAVLLPLFHDRFARVRAQKAPFFQVVHTYRLAPHSKGDDHRDPSEIEPWRAREPFALLRGHVADDLVAECLDKARERVDQALILAEQSPRATVLPKPDDDWLSQTRPVPWAKEAISFAQSLNRALGALLEDHPDVVLLGEDILDPYGGAFKVTKGLSSRWPDRVLASPISEAGLVAWGTGAALRGARPIIEIMFGDFLTLAADQILNHAAKYRWISGGELSVPLVIRTPMGGRRGYGPSHSQSIESMFLGIPGLTVVAASHLLEPGELLRRAALECNNPVLFIENKVLYPQRLLVNHEGRIGDFRVDSTSSCFPTLRLSLSEPEPPDVTLITYGGNAPIAMEVARRLLIEREVTCEIVLPCLLSPLPVEELLRFARAQTLVATLEEGQTPHGWGASVLAAFAEQAALAGRKCVRIGAAPCPVPAAGTLEALALPSADTVIETILRTLG